CKLLNAAAISATSLVVSGLSGSSSRGSSPQECGTSLPANSQCDITVQLTPGAAGPQSATLTVAFNDGVNPTSLTRGIAATTITGALLQIVACTNCGDDPSRPFDLGISGTPRGKIITVQNVGTV